MHQILNLSDTFIMDYELDLNESTELNSTQLDHYSNDNETSAQMKALMYIMYIGISLAAIIGNGIVIYIVLAYRAMRTVTNLFILNLACSDILMAILCIPFTFISNLLLQYWPFGSFMCTIVCYSQVVSVFISAYTLVAISVDRYIAIIYPLKPRMSKLHAKIIIIAVWIVSLLIPLPTALLSKLIKQSPELSEYTCMEDWSDTTKRYYYSMALMILQYVFPLFFLICTYSRIAFTVWGNQTPGEAHDKRDARIAASKRKMIKMMITVVLVFTICWLPINALIIIGDIVVEIYEWPHIHHLWFAVHWLSMSHTCCNPVIYCWMNSKFRDGFRQFASRCPCCPKIKSRLARHNNMCRQLNVSASVINSWSLSTNSSLYIRRSPSPKPKTYVYNRAEVSNNRLMTSKDNNKLCAKFESYSSCSNNQNLDNNSVTGKSDTNIRISKV